ncbi:centrosome-associated protein CEP250-like [Pomacea canaliculata]|uniref:centrosome-associated protein CEP250-like n=1 Tax=Pomacea canaliculata TaxID=400727 RepID=UPI000D73836A|nr:centrosome-associated protein CEP250-like [Pomacea canaliculata]
MAAQEEIVIDVATYKEEGKTIGLEGEALTKYILQCIERHERRLARAAEKEKAEREEKLEKEKAEREERLEKEKAEREERLEKEKAEREERLQKAEREERLEKAEREERLQKAEREERAERERREFELEKLRLENSERIIHNDSEPGRGGRNFQGLTPKLPLFKEELDDIDSFLYRFESHANALRWPKDLWPLHLSAILQGESLKLYHALCIHGSVEYEKLKRELLTKFQCTEEGYRERLRSIRPQMGESMISFSTRLISIADRWVELSNVEKSYNGLRDLLLREQLIQSVSRDLAVFLRERAPSSVEEMIDCAEKYRQAHPNKILARRPENAVAANATYHQPGKPNFPQSYPPRMPNTQTISLPTLSRPTAPIPPSHPSEYQRNNQPRQFQPRSPPTSESIQCYACRGYGHLARECANTLRREHNTAAAVDTEEATANIAVLCSSSIPNELGQLHLFQGEVKGKSVQVLRDTGATISGIRASLVAPHEYLNKRQTCITFGGRREIFPLARVQVRTPFYIGPLTCCVIKSPIVDLIIGNVRREATRCDVESERTKAQNVSQTQQPTIPRESTPQEVHETLNRKINDMSDEIRELRQCLQNFKENTERDECRLQRELRDRDKEIIGLKDETEVWRKERDELCKQQWVTVGDFAEKVRELELGHKKQSNDLQKALAEIKFFKEREESMKKELENTVTKEKYLDKEISANGETNRAVERLTRLKREPEQIYEDKRKTTKVYLDSRHQMSREVEEKMTDAGIVTKEFEVHQTFKELKTDLGKAKKRRPFSEDYYGTTFKELG